MKDATTDSSKAWDSDEDSLYQAFLSLETPEDCYSFLKDLCTPAEIQAMVERFKIARLLSTTDLSYRDLHEKTGVSIATIGRVARFLKQENYKGYQKVLSKLN